MSEFGKRAVLCLIAAVLLGAGTAVAQTTAKIEGVVRDSDTGSPLGGVQVTIKGTRLGNVTNEDGYYFVLNVPVGLRTVQFSFTGYEPLSVVDVRASAGNTITVDGQLRPAVIGLEGITIVGDAEPLMVRDNVQTKQRMDSEMINATPATAIEDLIVLQAGVVVDVSGNFSLRGGREGEELMYVDGVPVKSQNEQPSSEDRGGVDTDAGGVINPLVLAQDAVEEISVITGGFQAEFGNAQAGMINIVTKEGGPEFTGRVMFKSDQAMPRSMDYGFNQLDGNIGGPLFNENLTFFASGMMRGMADAFPRVSGDKGGFRGITLKFINGLNRDLSSIGVVKDGISDRSDAIDPLTVNSFADYTTVTKSPDFGYGVVNEDGTVTRGFSRDDGVAFRLLTQPTVVMDPTDVNSDGTIRSGAQPLIQIDPLTGNLWTIGEDGLATSSPEALDAAFAKGVAVANPLFAGPYSNPNPARLPGNWRDLYSTSLKAVYNPAAGLKALATYHRSRDQRQYYDHSYLFNRPERSNQAQRITTEVAISGLDWAMYQSSQRSMNAKLRVSYFKNDLDGGLLLPKYGFGRSTFMGVGGNIGFYNEDATNRYLLYSAVSNDGFAGDQLEPSSITPDLDRNELWPTDQVTASNIFGSTTSSRKGERGTRMYPRQFVNNGMALPLRNDTEGRWGVKLDFDSQLDRYSRLKFGFEAYLYDVRETTRFYYGEFTDDEWTAKPRLYAVYVNDRLDFGDLVIDIGLRMDRFDVNKPFPVIVGQNNPDFNDALKVPGAQTNWSPRIGVAHPVTERTQVRLSYGHFYQIPPFEVMYAMSERDFSTDALSNPNQTFGNGWLGMGETIQYEAGFTSLLTDDIVLDFVGYYRDVRGNIGFRLASADDLRDLAGVGSDYVIRGQGNLRVPANQDYGVIKGFDLTLDRRFSNYFGLRGTYSLMFARGTQSDPQEYVRTLARQLDPFTNQSPPPPAQLAPTDNDRTHQVAVITRFLFPDNFHEGELLGKILGDFGANFTIRYATGVPYTPIDKLGLFVTTSNAARTPGYTNADLRLTNSFKLGGDRITFFANILNLFENINYGQQGIDPTSGQVGIDKYFLEEILPSSLEMPVRTEAQLIRDLNKDGLVTKSEAAAASFAKGRAQDFDPRFWLRPREVRLGIEYNF